MSDTLPISVVIPHQKRRTDFFRRFCLPSVWANRPAQVIVEDWDGGACEKRNAGAKKATQPYLIFVDDDATLAADFLEAMLYYLSAALPEFGYIYTDYTCLVWPAASAARGPSHELRSHAFMPHVLRDHNYINTTSLMRRAIFPGFDPAIQRFQDWDLWLTLLDRGIHGIYLPPPSTLLIQHAIDPGITGSFPEEPHLSIVKRKHGLLVEAGATPGPLGIYHCGACGALPCKCEQRATPQ